MEYYRTRNKLYYATEEQKEAILDGEIFQTSNNDYYYILYPQTGWDSENVPSDVIKVERRYNGSVHAPKDRWNYQLVQDSDAVLYYGESLKKRIAGHVKLWMKSINPVTGKAFKGRDFKSYICALPKELIADENFANTILFAIKSTLVSRVKKAGTEEEIENLVKFNEVAQGYVREAHRAGGVYLDGKEQVANGASEQLKAARARAIEQMSKSAGLGKRK